MQQSSHTFWQILAKVGKHNGFSVNHCNRRLTNLGITECQLVQWLVKPGDKVEQFDPICEVSSDKATVEVKALILERKQQLMLMLLDHLAL